MKKADCMRTNAIVLVLLLAGCNGGTSDANASDNSQDARRQAMTGAFSNADCPFLFMRGRHGGLGTILGSSAVVDCDRVESTSDGRTLRLQNRDRTRCYILIVGQEPTIIDTPPGVFLNRENDVVLRCEDLARGEVLFSNGSQMHIPDFIVDADGQYLCVGGVGYDSNTKARTEAAITIRSVDTPNNVLVTSRTKGILWRSFCFQDKLYVCVRQFPEGSGVGGWIICEVYRREVGKLALIDRMKIESPLLLSSWVIVEGVCPNQEHMLLYAKRDLPLPSHRYLFDIRTHKIRDLGPAMIQNYAGFLDRHIFDRLLDDVASQPSEEKSSR